MSCSLDPASSCGPAQSFADNSCLHCSKNCPCRPDSLCVAFPSVLTCVNPCVAGTESIVVACSVGPAEFFEPACSFANIVCLCRYIIACVEGNSWAQRRSRTAEGRGRADIYDSGGTSTYAFRDRFPVPP